MKSYSITVINKDINANEKSHTIEKILPRDKMLESIPFDDIVKPSQVVIKQYLSIDGMLLRLVNEQSSYNILIAVRQNGLALQYVKQQSIWDVRAAVDQNPLAIQYSTFDKI